MKESDRSLLWGRYLHRTELHVETNHRIAVLSFDQGLQVLCREKWLLLEGLQQRLRGLLLFFAPSCSLQFAQDGNLLFALFDCVSIIHVHFDLKAERGKPARTSCGSHGKSLQTNSESGRRQSPRLNATRHLQVNPA